MQNFTIRLGGKSFFLPIFLLLVGLNYSAVAQNCPTVSDTSQDFCYLDRVSDLAASPNGSSVRWYRTADSTNPIPENEILQDGMSYFAGNEDGTCDARVEVTVTVSDLGEPTSQFGNFYEPCVYTPDDVTTVADLKALITPNDPSYDLNVYAEEYGDASSELGDGFVLVDGDSYFIGQDDGGSCQYSSRIAIEYSPVEAFAPDAEPNQQFCEGDDPTVADLMATGTSPNTQAFRWYSTETSNPQLSEDTPLIDGETYYVSQIVNRTNSVLPPCESEQRTAVTVEIQDSDAGPDNTDNEICVSQAETEFANSTSARNYFLSLLEFNNDADTDNDVPTDGTFSPSIASILSSSSNGSTPGIYQTTYTVTFDNGCTDEVLLGVEIQEDPYAGEDTDIEICLSELQSLVGQILAGGDPVVILADYIEGADIDLDGEFTDLTPIQLALQFQSDLATNNFPATYTTTYTVSVGDDAACEDSAQLSLTVLPDADAGEDTSASLCETEADAFFADDDSLRTYLTDLLGTDQTTGTFSPSLADLRSMYNDGDVSGDYTTEYTVDNGGCVDMATVTVSVEAAVPAEAGTIASQSYCSTDAAVTLSDLLDGTAVQGGEFSSPDIDVTSGTFDPSSSGEGSFDITYTVSEDDPDLCVTGTSTANFTITVETAPDAGSDATASLCENEVEDQGIFDSEADLQAYFLDLLGADDTSGEFSPALSDLIADYNDGDTSGDYTVTYTVEGTICDNATATATLTIQAATPADAGTGSEVDYCSNDAAIDLTTLLSGDYDAGTFSSDDADVADGMFDPTAEGAGDYEITYTVSPETACVTGTATSTILITVNQAPNAGPGGDFSFCVSEFEAIAAAVIANPSGMGMELLNELDPTITPGGTFSDDTLMELLAQYNATTSFPATFTTTYTVSNDDCTASADYSITINPNEDADAGSDQSVTFCTTDGVQDLNDFIGDDAMTGGSFDGYADGMFDPAAAGAGEYTIIYSVDETSGPCIEGSATAEITVTVVEGIEAGDDVTEIVCTADVEDDLFTEDGLNEFYLGLLGDDVPANGTFNPSIASLVDMYNGGMMTGDFTTTYTIGNGTCEDSVELTLTIRDIIEAELEDVADVTVCQNAGVQDLTSLLGNNPTLGEFSLDGTVIDGGLMNPGDFAPGDYEITYTLSEENAECVTGSASITFTVTVQDSAFAGEDMMRTFCNNGSVRNLFNLLGDNVDDNGDFTINGDLLTDGSFDPSDYAPGMVEVTYTVPSENDCGSDSATYTFTIQPAPNAGDDFTYTVCQNADALNLTMLLADGVSMGGSFQLDGNPIDGNTINPSDLEPGDYSIAYVLLVGDCSDSSVLTLTVQDAANAGEDLDLSVCMSDDIVDLYSQISADADMNGTFTLDGEVIADGMMDPSEFAAGTYTVTYTVDEINDCGEDMSTLTITVQETPDAPVVSDFVFCANQGPTGANLIVDGEDNLTFYTDADLMDMVTDETVLTTNTYYVTTRDSDTGCESEAAEVLITVNDTPTPTIESTTADFCEFDDATVADLAALISADGTLMIYDSEMGDTELSMGTLLQSGTYYASATNDTGCESSVRLPITVNVEDCPIIIPEGFSPNNDNTNDRFVIEDIEKEYPNYTIEIYNRWGDVVYRGNASTPTWDGTSTVSGGLGDGVLPAGAYFYLLNYNDGATEPVRGTVYLSR